MWSRDDVQLPQASFVMQSTGGNEGRLWSDSVCSGLIGGQVTLRPWQTEHLNVSWHNAPCGQKIWRMVAL